MNDTVSGLALLRAPFPAHQISKLPKPTKAQTDEVKADFKKGARCQICGGWHHPNVVHLDYVGHAALTDRLLDADAQWSWEPAALRDGLPAFDASGGLWIKLTVCGVSRLGYGHAAPKPGQDPGAREKEVIGDALRNAAMRFGAALDLWHKGDLHGGEDGDDARPPSDAREASAPSPAPLGRKSAAQAKRDGDDKTIKDEINKCDLAGLVDWEANFDSYTAHVPNSWADPIRDMIALRREELLTPPPEGEAEMDEAFRQTMGRPVSAPVAGANGRSTVNA